MGKILVSGMAKKEYPCDRVCLHITFVSSAKSTAEAMNAVLHQCETFISALEAEGFAPSLIHLDDDTVQRHRFDDEISCTAERTVELKMAADPAVINSILEMISRKGLNAEIDTDYELSRCEALEKELLEESIEQAKKKAELSAAALGKKIVALEDLQIHDSFGADPVDWMQYKQERCAPALGSSYVSSDELGLPVKTLSQSVQITWITD